MLVYILSIETIELGQYRSDALGVYRSYNLAKLAGVSYAENSDSRYKKKNAKKEDIKKLIFQGISKKNSCGSEEYVTKLYIEEVKFKMTERKLKKDSNATNKGLSSYMFFTKDKHEEIKISNLDEKFGDMRKLLVLAWNELKYKSKRK